MATRKKVIFDLFVQDCVQGLSEFVKTDSIDAIITSPPYNLGIPYLKYQDKRQWADYFEWMAEWAFELARVLKPRGSLFLNLGCSPSTPLLPHQAVDHLTSLQGGFVLQNTIHWVKSIALPGPGEVEVQRGHYKPINSTRYLNDCHEFVFHLTLHGRTPLHRTAIGIPYADKSNIQRWGHTRGQDLKCRGNTWFIPYKTISSRAKDRPHPATFPTELAVKCLKLHGVDSKSVVLDPFMGIGHAAYAAAQCNVKRFIGYDIEVSYVEVASNELKEMGYKPSVRVLSESK